ncbi:MAG: PDZ domain-containing protein [Spirochaetes bacterium]|jgi:general secretion pathway protein C|nr:PDZ domain-containing protein [Spirochaetota bacterium]
MSSQLKFHAITFASVALLAALTSFGINMILGNTLFSPQTDVKKALSRVKSERGSISTPSHQNILESSLFRLAELDEAGEDDVSEAPAQVSDLSLLGTITGSVSIARALVSKRGEKNSEVFKIGQNVYGYVLTWITETKVYLKKDDQKMILDMYPPKETAPSSRSSASRSSGSIKTTLSRSELQQDLKNNMDNMLRGLVVSPYRKDGQIIGYRLKRVSSQNMLYKYGMRSGDILQKINGHQITSTQKLYELWQTIPNESKVVINVQRRGKDETFEFIIND